MITRIEVLNYKCLQDIRQDVSPLQVLVGPNASGKSTLLDVLRFIRDLFNEGTLEPVIRQRSQSFEELIWREGSKQPAEPIEFLIEATVPPEKDAYLYQRHSGKTHRYCRYTIRIGVNHPQERVEILDETFLLSPHRFVNKSNESVTLFRKYEHSPNQVVRRTDSHFSYHSEYVEEDINLHAPYASFPIRPAIAAVPYEVGRFEITRWFYSLLSDGVKDCCPQPHLMRIAVDPLAGKTLHSDGSNLPIVVRELQKQGPKRFDWWIKHLRTDLHDLDNLTVETLSDTKRLYLVYHTVGGAKIPHWQLSDGTLRFLALTLIAYMPNNDGIYLIEEPENGIHPLAIEAVYQSLSSVYEGQVFLATHSPLLVGLAKPEELLCFDKAKDGATQIVRGDQHPRLKEWHREVSLGTLFASGVFGGA